MKVTAGFSQGFVLAPILYSLYANNSLTAPGTHFAQLADDTFTLQRNTSVMFLAKYNAASPQ
jgi:hypothetical protein